MIKKIKKPLGTIIFGLTPIILSSCSILADPVIHYFDPQFVQVLPQNNDSEAAVFNHHHMPILPWAQKYAANSQVNPNKISLPNYSASNRNVLDFFIRRMIVIGVGHRSRGLQYGTGIILAKATSNENDLKYYVATNAHVSNGFLPSSRSTIMGYHFAISPFFKKYWNNSNLPQASNFADLNETAINSNISKSETNSSASSTLDLSKSDFYPMFLNKNTNNSNSVFVYQAKDLLMENIKQLTRRSSKILEPVKGSISTFENQGLAADFSIMEVSFPNANSIANNLGKNRTDSILLMSNEKTENYKNFLTSLKSLPDAKFGVSQINSTTPGYLMGYPSDWNRGNNESKKLYMVNLAIAKPAALQFPLGHNLAELEIVNQPPSISILNQQKKYWTPTSNYSVANLNLGPGASGSIYVNDKAEIEGVYWGIIANSDNQIDSNDDRTFTVQSSGQITKLRVKSNYDTITSINSSQTTNTGSNFCSAIHQRQTNDQSLRLPDFCK